MSRLLSLYPPAWRARYGEEFLALLADRPPSIADRLDIVRGGVDAHLRPQLGPVERDLRVAAPFLGIVALAAVMGLIQVGPEVTDEHGTYRDGAGALPAWAIAAITLAVGFVAAFERFPTHGRVAGVGRAAAVTAVIAVALLMFGPWLLLGWAVAFGATLTVAIAGLRSGWPRVRTTALAIVAVPPLLITVALAMQPYDVGRGVAWEVYATFSISAVLLWPLLGLALAGAPRVRDTAMPAGTSVAPQAVP